MLIGQLFSVDCAAEYRAAQIDHHRSSRLQNSLPVNWKHPAARSAPRPVASPRLADCESVRQIVCQFSTVEDAGATKFENYPGRFSSEDESAAIPIRLELCFDSLLACITALAASIFQKKTRQVCPCGFDDNVRTLLVSRYSCHSHPRTSGAPYILCVFSYRACQYVGTLRGRQKIAFPK